MLIEELKDLWICQCGNWVDKEFKWCPDCCEDREKGVEEKTDLLPDCGFFANV